LIALLLAAAAAYPAPAQAALSIDDPAGLRAFLDAAGVYARSVSSAEVGHALREQVGLDPLTLTRPHTLVFSRRSVGLIATVDAATARETVAAWKRRDSAWLYAKGKLYTARGPQARALLKAMQRPRPLPQKGAAVLWMALAPPLKAATFSLQASAQGLDAVGVVTASKPLLQGPSPRCDTARVGCFAAGLGPAGRELLHHALAAFDLPAALVRRASRAAGRLDGIEVAALGGRYSVIDALDYALVIDAPGAAGGGQCALPTGIAAISNPACAQLPSLEAPEPGASAALDLAQVDAALAQLTALDALKGEAAAGAYGAHLLYGELLRHLGPLTLHAKEARNAAAAAELSLRLPLR
jgi:hypothetical protein